MKRREFIQLAATSSASLGVMPSAIANVINYSSNSVVPEIDLIAAPSEHQILPQGLPTQMLSFSGNILNGSSEILSQGYGFLGPKIEVRKGQKLKVNFKNELSEDSIVHWHGLHLDEANDGHPSYAVSGGQSYSYELDVQNRAGLYWYHPHPHGRTGFQVYQGLAGLFVVRDEEEDSLNLPSGDNELFMVFQDRHFDDDNQLIYVQSGHDIMMGKMGNTLFVNGGREFKREIKAESYRLRILNGSNARSYRLKWDDNRPLIIIGTDGGLIESPVEMDSVLLSPGERLDIIVNFESKNVGDNIELLSIPVVDNGNGQPFTLYQFEVTEPGESSFTLPSQLSNFERIDATEAVNPTSPKSFKLEPKMGVGWTIDGLSYDMNDVRPKETVELDTTEIWEFDLTDAGMIHPMHIHGSQFQVLERINGPYSDGIVFDKGWKDTVAVLPGDKVRVIKRFNDFKGKFLFHCHILEHEDSSMMRNFLVE